MGWVCTGQILDPSNTPQSPARLQKSSLRRPPALRPPRTRGLRLHRVRRAFVRWKSAGSFHRPATCLRIVSVFHLQPFPIKSPKTLVLGLILAFAFAAPARVCAISSGGPAPITAPELTVAHQAWCDALLKISKTHRDGGNARAVAEQVIDGAYNYAAAPVLFKPTLTHGEQTFRMTRAGALAYFVGGDKNFPDDSGFALKPWTAASFKIAGTYIEGPLGITMGHVTLTDDKGAKTTVEKTFVFRRGDDGKLRIVLHKSALPYSPKK